MEQAFEANGNSSSPNSITRNTLEAAIPTNLSKCVRVVYAGVFHSPGRLIYGQSLRKDQFRELRARRKQLRQNSSPLPSRSDVEEDESSRAALADPEVRVCQSFLALHSRFL